MTTTTTCVKLADFSLIRVAALPADILTPVTLPALQRTLAELSELRATHVAVKQSLCASLHELVPKLDAEPRLRRDVVNLRRAIFNEKPLRLSQARIAEICAHLDDNSASELAGLEALVERHESLQRQLKLQLPEMLVAAGSALDSAVGKDDFSAGVAASSETFFAAMSAENTPFADPKHRVTRTLFSYLCRAALKTSPFSSFTSIGMIQHGSLKQTPNPRLRSKLIPAVRLLLLNACARDKDCAAAFDYEPVPLWRRSTGELRALIPNVVTTEDFHWRTESLVDVSIYREFLEKCAALGRRPYAAMLTQLPGSQPADTLRRYLDVGLLRVVAPWHDHDSDSLEALSILVDNVGTSRATDIAARIRNLSALAHELMTTSTARRRSARKELRQRLRALLDLLDTPQPKWLERGKLAYEDFADVQLPSGRLHMPPTLAADLAALSGLVRPGIYPSALYEALTHAFIERHGQGGRCDDVMQFCDWFCSRSDVSAVLAGVVTIDKQRLAAQATVPGPSSPCTAAPSVTVLYQIVSDGPEALARGDYLVVVNQYSAGMGGLFARLAHLFPNPKGLPDALRSWVKGMFPKAEICELLPARDVSSLQHASAGLFPKLRWPGDTPTQGCLDSLSVEDLVLCHLRDTNSLVLCTRDGRPVATPHLGTVPDHQVFGPLRILLTISNPWVAGSLLCDRQASREGRSAPPEGIAHIPRDQRGRLVLRRARWLLRGRAFPLREATDTDASYLIRVDRWRRSHAMPHEVFLNVEGTLERGVHKERKPQWLCFSSLHALCAVQSIISQHTDSTLALVEALPGRAQHWAHDQTGEARATELMTLLRWSTDLEQEESHT